MKRSFDSVAKCLRVHRKEKGFSQEGLAAKIGYKNAQFVSNVERGKCSIPAECIRDFSQHLEVEPGVIIDAMVDDYRRFLSQSATTEVSNG